MADKGGVAERPTLKSRVEDNLSIWMLSLLLAGFLAGYKTSNVLVDRRGNVAAATLSPEPEPPGDGVRPTSVKDRFVVVIKSFTTKDLALREARRMWAEGMDPRIYEATNRKFALGFPALSAAHAEKLRQELLESGMAKDDAYISTSVNFRTRWLFDVPG